ncbi:MAG TPA: hypothetical protein VFJ19_05195 [Nocardioidaceae bacterium]|nr:hypothetical protein [Nocardioidaceae bacterium]
MTEPALDEMVSDSGGTMVRLTGPARMVEPDLDTLEPLRPTVPGPLRPAGDPPYFESGDVLTWHYVNLELVHQRPVDGSRRVHTRDLTLDLWLEGDDVWLKDADELDAFTAAGWYSPDQARVIREVAEQARFVLAEHAAWPLDEGWETWQPAPEWDEPLDLPEWLMPAGGS